MLVKVTKVFSTLVFCSCHACCTFNNLHIRSSRLTGEQHFFANAHASGTKVDKGDRLRNTFSALNFNMKLLIKGVLLFR